MEAGHIEAMSFSKPVVTKTVCGIQEAVQHGKTGLQEPPKDSQSLADALLNLIGDEPLRLRMGVEGRKKYESGSYSVEAYLNSTLEAYEEARGLLQNFS